MSPRRSLSALPLLVERKLYKTGQTRGAHDDEIFQNRVGRNSTVLIPLEFWPQCRGEEYENGYVVLVSPHMYFTTPNVDQVLAEQGLEIARNALVFYQTRRAWDEHPPWALGWRYATSRLGPDLGGQYVARVPATTARDNGTKINEGFTTTASKGAGIRVYEYAPRDRVNQCRLQLEALIWLCRDADIAMATLGMPEAAITQRKAVQLATAQEQGLLDYDRLYEARVVNAEHVSVCPLCLEEIKAGGFAARVAQAAGRETPDQTITELSLFHVEELRVGTLQHRTYNVGWGHHHCNVVTKDSGITPTLDWMYVVLERNAMI